MADARLETSRLDLCPPQPADLPFVLAEMNTPAVMQYLGGEVLSDDGVAARHAADIAAFATGEWRRWVIRRRADGRRIGQCGLFRVRTEAAPAALRGRSEIGWTLAEAFQGQGYATEAAGAVLGFAFVALGLTEIFSQTSDSNVRSTLMMHRLGFAPQPDLGYVDPDYPARDNPTTVWKLAAQDWRSRG